MKKRKNKELEPCVVEVYSKDEADLLDLLLIRVIGPRTFFAKRTEKPAKTYRFIFWATKEEKKLLENAWDKVVQAKWEGVEEAVLEHVSS